MNIPILCEHAKSINRPDAVRCRAKAYEKNGVTVLPVVRVRETCLAPCPLRKPQPQQLTINESAAARPAAARGVPLEILERAEGRAIICDGCDACRSVSRWVGRFWAGVVSCEKCSRCSGVSLVAGSCPVGKW